MIQIEPLTSDFVEEAIALNERVFPPSFVNPNETFWESLDPEKLKLLNKKFRAIGEPEVRSLEYWIARDDKKNKVIGTTGFYEKVNDCSDECWVEWYCVHPDYRGQGIGSRLLDFTLSEAKKRGKTSIKLYTSTNPDEARSQEMYKRRGFTIREDLGRMPEGGYEIFFMECKLK